MVVNRTCQTGQHVSQRTRQAKQCTHLALLRGEPVREHEFVAREHLRAEIGRVPGAILGLVQIGHVGDDGLAELTHAERKGPAHIVVLDGSQHGQYTCQDIFQLRHDAHRWSGEQISTGHVSRVLRTVSSGEVTECLDDKVVWQSAALELFEQTRNDVWWHGIGLVALTTAREGHQYLRGRALPVWHHFLVRERDC